MKYVIKLFDQYYLRVNKDTWDEVYSPYFATTFPKAKDAKKWVEDNTTFSDSAKAVRVDRAIANYDKWVEAGMVRRTFNFLDGDISRFYNNEDKYQILEWRWKYLNTPDFEIKQEHYNSWPNLYDVFEHLWSFEKYHSEDFYEHFFTIKIRVRKDSEYAKFKEELDLVLDRLNFFDKDGCLVINVFDSRCVIGYAVKLFKRPDGKWYVEGRYNQIVGPTTLKKCFEYLKAEAYYED
ncbi:MAG: hypothetical protein WDZ68_01675 [Candidatus Paceibacterota bacterium]